MASRITQVAVEVLVTPDETGTPAVPVTEAHDCAFLKKYYNPRVAIMQNGQPGMLLRAQPSPYGGTPNRVYFISFTSESKVKIPPVELFSYDTFIMGLVNYKGTLVAVCYNPASQTLRVRTSVNNGLDWNSEADLPTGLPARNFVTGSGTGVNRCGLSLVTSRDGSALYLFYLNIGFPAGTNKSLMYRTTSAATAFTGWSGELDSGYDVFSVGRNYGGATARNSQDTIAFSGPIETKIDGTWVVGAESDDTDFHANHGVSRGTLGGVWTLVYNDGFGGGISGGQGSNGAMFYDENKDIMMTNMEDNGDSVLVRRSSDNGATWWGDSEQMPAGTVVGLGQHTGTYVANWGRVYVFSGLAGLLPASTEKTDLYATRITLDLSLTPRTFTDILGEAGLYTCDTGNACVDHVDGPGLPIRLSPKLRIGAPKLSEDRSTPRQGSAISPKSKGSVTNVKTRGMARSD